MQTTYSYALNAPFRQAAIARLKNAGIGVVAMKVIIAVAEFMPREIKLPNEGPLAAIKWVLLNPAISTTAIAHPASFNAPTESMFKSA